MASCTFCGNTIAAGTGFLFVKTDGKVLHFCRRRCEKHMHKLKHKPMNMPWTKEAQLKKQETKK